MPPGLGSLDTGARGTAGRVRLVTRNCHAGKTAWLMNGLRLLRTLRIEIRAGGHGFRPDEARRRRPQLGSSPREPPIADLRRDRGRAGAAVRPEAANYRGGAVAGERPEAPLRG